MLTGNDMAAIIKVGNKKSDLEEEIKILLEENNRLESINEIHRETIREQQAEIEKLDEEKGQLKLQNLDLKKLVSVLENWRKEKLGMSL